MSDPIQGFDVSVAVVGPNGPELCGEYMEVSIKISNDVVEYQETNERIARLLDGPIKIEGSLKRGWMNVDIISRTLGARAIRRGEKQPASPRFVIGFTAKNAIKGISGRLRVEQAIINEISLAVKAGGDVVEKDLSFRAEGVSEA